MDQIAETLPETGKSDPASTQAIDERSQPSADSQTASEYVNLRA